MNPPHDFEKEARAIAEEAANFAGYAPKARMRASFVGYVYHLAYKALRTAVAQQVEKDAKIAEEQANKESDSWKGVYYDIAKAIREGNV